MASCSLSTSVFQGPLIHKSQFLGQNHITILPQYRTISSTFPKTTPSKPITIRAKFELSELLGGRGLCNGELGLQQELEKERENPPQNTGNLSQESAEREEELSKTAISNTEIAELPDDVFEKELFGLTGGFPGGEKGLQEFLKGKPLHDLMIKVEKHASIGLFPSSLKKLKLSQLLSFGNDRDRYEP